MNGSLHRRHVFMLAMVVCPAVMADDPSEASLRAADAEQMRIIVQGDASAQQDFMHSNYIVNGPSNRVMRKPALVAMLAQGSARSQ